jgi:DNA-binding transcriptional MerR regulator
MASETQYRIGEVAERTGVTTRTIRYYEELGLLGAESERQKGRHRLYCETDVVRLEELIRLRDLLGVSLEELKELVEAEDARAALRAEWRRGVGDPRRRRDILVEATGHIDRQLALVRRRQAELDRLAGELTSKRRRLRARLRDLDQGGTG